MIPFAKAHACGNDFLIVIDDAAGDLDRAELTRGLCSRNTGVGADGVEFFTWTGPKAGRIRLYNADGSIAEISGNGTRCVAAWMAETRGAKIGEAFEIATDAGPRICQIDRIDAGSSYRVDVTTGMGIPRFTPHTLKLLDGDEVIGVEVNIGNPHFVTLVDNPAFTVEGKAWQSLGAEICTHRDFPHQANVEFVRVVSENEIEIRIFERGVGPTASSGTGTCASSIAVLALRRCVSPLTVIAPGGAQTTAWAGPGKELFLTGPATLIARGEAW